MFSGRYYDRGGSCTRGKRVQKCADRSDENLCRGIETYVIEEERQEKGERKRCMISELSEEEQQD